MKKIFLIILILTLPTYALMLRSGIFTMHDFHVFRQQQFDKCVSEGTFPCRWSPDSSWGYGQPVFNFYGQFPYWLGELARLAGASILDSVKFSFIFSLLASAFTMYLLASRFWGRAGGLISALFYVYAPYRAVDVWVRGALPESLAFVFYPLILYFLDTKRYLLFSLSLAFLLITHNLSTFMFLPFLGLWWLVRSRDLKVVPAGLLALAFTAFYWLPVAFEKQLVTLNQTTQNYYFFPYHFTTLYQLFISTIWGYGGSVWGPNDTMSFSVGHVHWTAAIFVGFLAFIRRRKSVVFNYLLFVSLAILALFLTHGKSEIIWKTLPGLAFIQFPWRFLSLTALFFSLSLGAITTITPRLTPYLILLLVFTSSSFFRPDIWRHITDTQQFSGQLWDEQRRSAISDFWPAAATSLPPSPAPDLPQITFGEGAITSSFLGAHKQRYEFDIESSYAKVVFSTVYFPGWTASLDDSPLPTFTSSDLSLISARLPRGKHTVILEFKDTPPRTLGNLISSLSLLGTLSFLGLKSRAQK